MMDFGYLGSSSNLSPLAPPFTLDRTNSKPNTENFVNFTDPPQSVPFSSSLTSWQYSPSSVSNSNLFSNSNADLGVESFQTNYPTSKNYYPYFGTPSITSPTAQIPPLNVTTAPDAFAFSQYSNEIPKSHVESNNYCSSFVSPVGEADNPRVALNKPNYDLSSNSHITPLDVSSQADYNQSLFGLKYKPQWGSYWDSIDKFTDGEMGKKVEYDGNFCSTQTDSVGSHAYRPYPKQGASTEGFNISNNVSAFPYQTCVNLLGGESQIVTPTTGEMDYKPFSTQGSSFTRYDPARKLKISTNPKSHLIIPTVEAVPPILNKQKPYAFQDQSFQIFNSSKIGSVTIRKPSPPLVIKPPSVASNLCLDKKGHFPDSFSSKINKSMAENVEGKFSKTEIESQLSFISASDRAKSVSSVEGPLESLDRNYPALDSPCWKGSSSFNFSPSENHGSVNSEQLVKKPESLSSLKIQQNQFFTPFEDNIKISEQKINENGSHQENGYVELGSLLGPDKFPNSSSSAEMENVRRENVVDHAKMRSSKVDHFSINIENLTKISDLEKGLELGFGVAEAKINCLNESSKLNVQTLVDTIYNLSELLLLQCSEEASVITEVSHEALNLAMKNLDACVSKIVPHKSIKSGMPQVTKEASSNLGFENYPSQKGIKDSEVPEKEDKKLSDLLSSRVDKDFEKDDKLTQAIKNVLEENISTDEEMQSETRLYKNLWLEAEAALCSVSFRARYDRMKTEMDKSVSPKTKEPAKTFEELYNEVFPDTISPEKGNPMIEAFKILHKSTIQDPSASRTTENVDEVDASIRERLNILNNRVSNNNSVDEEEQINEEADAAFAETIKTVEKLLSSEDADDCEMSNLAQNGPPFASRNKKDDNVEARVMARFQLLKNRDFNKISEKSGENSEQAVSSEFLGETNPWRFDAVLYDDDIVEHKPDHLYGNERLGAQLLSSGWGDGSLSDWEDVLKDDHCC